jgi:hypothetical protein
VGYYPSIAALTGDRGEYSHYYRDLVDKLTAHGLNYFRNVFTMGQPYADDMLPYMRTGPGTAADGNPRVDLGQFNPDYFDYWRQVISYANANGVVVQLTIFDAWHNKGWVVEDNGDEQHEWGMKYDFYNGANNINGIDTADQRDWTDTSHPVFEYQQALIRQVVDHLGGLPGIIFEICNENYEDAAWELQLADYLTEYEASKGLDRHLVMPRDLPNHDQAGGKGMDPDTTHDELVANFSKGKPLIADNDGGGSASPAGTRHKAWGALTAGGHISYFHWELHRDEVLHSAEVSERMRYLGNILKFLEASNLDLRGMRPADDLLSRGWAYALEGERYLIYLAAGGDTTVSGLPGSYSAQWFNPRTGEVQPAAGGPTFRAPDGNDWALWVGKAAKCSADLNLDGEVDALDTQEMVIAVLEDNPDGLCADLDGDQRVDESDLRLLVSQVLEP